MNDHVRRRDIWGDDPEERDASAVVEELLAESGARRWHDHPSIVWVKAVGRFIARNSKRVAVTIAGFAVLLAGAAMLVLPGPGIAGDHRRSRDPVHRVRVGAASPEARQGESRASQERSVKEEGGPMRPAPPRGSPPVVAGTIQIGTSSWTDPTLIKDGNFYPPGTTSAKARLEFYASRFPLVEVDSTYYFPPSEKNSVLWIERTPARLHVQHQGLLAAHEPPHAHRVPLQGPRGRASRRDARETPPLPRQASRRDGRRGLAAVP